MRNSSIKEYWKHYHHEQLLLQLIIYRNFYDNVWNFLAFSIFNTCLINTPHSLFPLGLWALASDPRKQEENVKTRIWNEPFITDVLTHTHTFIQNEAFNAVETLQQLQWEDRELQHQVTKGKHHITNGGGLSYPGHCFPPLVWWCEHPLLLVKMQFYDLRRNKRVCAVWI